MSIFTLFSLLISLSAIFAYINHRFIKMPFVIGLFFQSILLSLSIVSLKFWDIQYFSEVKSLVENNNISSFIINGMLGFLLFAGAFHTNWDAIRKQWKSITFLAILGTIVSTLLIALLFSWVCQWFAISISWIHCLIFGALLSPTDPIAVLGILTKANVPKRIESTIVGESLFNDGIGVVIFVALIHTLNAGETQLKFDTFALLFVQEAIGGALFGIILGYLLHYLLKSIDHYETEVLLTLAFVMSGYALANYCHISGALAMVIMGLLVGNFKPDLAMSDETQAYVHKFWELLDVILNAILFITIAFIMLVLEIKTQYILIGLSSIFITIFVRALVIYIPFLSTKRLFPFSLKECNLMVWGGLRGGLSLALVLAVPNSEIQQLLIFSTYSCVVFSILVQGLTIEKLAKRLH